MQESSLQLDGMIRTVLTWNFGKHAFLAADGSRDRYQFLRGGREFARFARDLKQKITDSEFFELEPGGEADLEQPYSAGLWSQYVVDYEFLPTYRIREGVEPTFAFEGEIAKKLNTKSVEFRQALEFVASQQFLAAWTAWPIKRFRLSRYGLLQVVLEKKTEGFQSVETLLKPVTLLGKSMSLRALAQDAQISKGLEHELSALASEASDLLVITVQWEIVGRILSWLIQATLGSSSREERFRFDPDYCSSWRDRKAHSSGHSLRLRTRFVIISVHGIKSAHEVKELTADLRLDLARLLEGTIPFVDYENQWQQSPQRPDWLQKIVDRDEASWDNEACFLANDSAVIAGLYPPGMVMKFDCDLPYQFYWPIVARAFEYLAELSLMARLIAQKTSDELETLMLQLAEKGRLADYENTVRFSGAAASVVARLRNASAPSTISPSEALFSKIVKLSSIFGIANSLDHAERNIAAIQRQVSHAESVRNELSILHLTLGLAAFTAILMGLALPPFYHYSRELLDSSHGTLRETNVFLDQVRQFPSVFWLPWAAKIWGQLAALLTILALAMAAYFLARLLRFRRRIPRWPRSFKRWEARH